MIHPTLAMRMAMGNFLFGSVSDSTDFHVESKRLASQWVVGVNIHIKSSDLDNGDLDRPLLGLQANHLSRLQLLWKSKMLGWNALDIRLIFLSVGIGGFNRYLKFVAH